MRLINARRRRNLRIRSSLRRTAVRATKQLTDRRISGARPSIGEVNRVVREGPGEWTGGATSTRGRSTKTVARILERQIRTRGPSGTDPKFSQVGCAVEERSDRALLICGFD